MVMQVIAESAGEVCYTNVYRYAFGIIYRYGYRTSGADLHEVFDR